MTAEPSAVIEPAVRTTAHPDHGPPSGAALTGVLRFVQAIHAAARPDYAPTGAP